ncbi:MAG: hypothetical protein KDA46_00725 [Parvularculaceae bacterium]|nr:hypothetical protein [Parvularculaceae bacterium]
MAVSLLLIIPFLAQASSLPDVDALAMKHPPRPDPYAKCVCEDADAASVMSFVGIVSDAQVLLGEDGRSPAARQATIFRVVKTVKGEVSNPARVWHMTAPEECGVTFDYGKRYDVRVIAVEDGLETSWCLKPSP